MARHNFWRLGVLALALSFVGCAFSFQISSLSVNGGLCPSENRFRRSMRSSKAKAATSCVAVTTVLADPVKHKLEKWEESAHRHYSMELNEHTVDLRQVKNCPCF